MLRERGHVDLEDQPELYGKPDTRAPDAWASVLERYPAHLFATLTFRPYRRFTDKYTGATVEVPRVSARGGMHPEAADKAFRVFVSKINGDIYGRSWGYKWHRGLQWARGQEFHKDGRLHFHAILSAPRNDLWNLTRISRWHRWWLDEFGFNRLERPRSQRDIAAYVSKYVTKGGEVDFSANYGAWTPPVPDFETHQQQAVLLGHGA
ncbi:hypothetical protein [Luteimonas sp. R10]|uniref:rolling circle replication-associated protein n=1 Tax=Luteimonas sp. R10 TaxID=3108176 RepID=UPI003088F537|nr:hypothetical protein U3649_11965 [Luteimonas sp. R10]